VFVYATPSRIKLVGDDGTEVVEEFDEGFVRFVEIDDPATHKIENVSEQPHRQFLVELKPGRQRGKAGTNGRSRLIDAGSKSRGGSPRSGPASPFSPEARVAALGLTLSDPAPPVGTYVGASRTGNLVFLSGHGPYEAGQWRFQGKVGR